MTDHRKLRELAEAQPIRFDLTTCSDEWLEAAANPTTVLALLDDNERLQTALAAMTAARDEACDLATEILDEFHENDPETDLETDRGQLAELRKVGK